MKRKWLQKTPQKNKAWTEPYRKTPVHSWRRDNYTDYKRKKKRREKEKKEKDGQASLVDKNGLIKFWLERSNKFALEK